MQSIVGATRASYGGREGHSRHVAATSGRCRADVAAMALRRRSDVAAMALRRRSDVAAMALRRRSNVAATALRRRCDVAPISPLQNMCMRIPIKMSRLARKHEGLSFMMMEELGISSRRVTHGENVSVKYHQLVGHYRIRCCISLATVKLRYVDRQSVLYSPLQYSCTLSSHKYLYTCLLLCHSIETLRSLRTPL